MNGARRKTSAEAEERRARYSVPQGAEQRRGGGTRIVEMPPKGGKALRYTMCYFLGRNALPMMSASK